MEKRFCSGTDSVSVLGSIWVPLLDGVVITILEVQRCLESVSVVDPRETLKGGTLSDNNTVVFGQRFDSYSSGFTILVVSVRRLYIQHTS